MFINMCRAIQLTLHIFLTTKLSLFALLVILKSWRPLLEVCDNSWFSFGEKKKLKNKLQDVMDVKASVAIKKN